MLVKLVGLCVLGLLEGIVSVSLAVIFLLPAFFILFIVNQTIRFSVSILLYCRYKGQLQLTDNGLDSIWGYKTPGNSRNVLFIAVYENKIDGYRYRDKFLKEVIEFEAPDGSKPYLRLKKIFTKACGYFCWKEDTEFDIANHIIIYPDDKVVTESEMLEMLGELSQDMDEKHPQWQEIIIPRFVYDKYLNTADNVPRKEQSLRILRFHHAIADGGSWILLYSYCMANGKIPYAVNPLVGYPVPSWKLGLYYANCCIFGTTTALKAMWNGQNVKNRLVTEHYNGTKYYAWTDILDLALLKEIKKKTNTSIPTVLASIVAAAIKNYNEKFPAEGKTIGPVTEIGAVAALLPYPNLKPQNRFTICNFPVPTGDMTRIDRLKLTHRKGIQLSQSPEPVLNFYMFKFFGRFPIFIQRCLMRSAGTSMIFSNLPGASTSFSLWDDAVEDGAAWIPLLTVAGLSLAACGYKEQIRFCGVTDSACMSRTELEFLLNEIKNEINLLAADVIGIV